jgi:hypothetical protein
MKHTLYVSCILLCVVIFQSCLKKRHKQDSGSGQTITIPFDPNRFSSLNAFVSKITVVPLETNDDCLIGQSIASVKLHQDLIYINSHRRQLLVFDLNGNFIRNIGSVGQGPGEFREMRDFIFTNDGNIEILDSKKIETYTLDGKHIGTKKYNLLGKDLYCNPMYFCPSNSNEYFFWGGTLGLRDEKLREKSSLMYLINKNMQVERGYFSTRYGDGGIISPFKYYQDYVLVTPSAFDYNIYQIDGNDSVSIRYSFDFGKYAFDINKDIDRKTIAYENYIREISDYEETDRFLYSSFVYKNLIYNLLYSKTTGEKHIHALKPELNEKEFRLLPVYASYEDQLVSVADIITIKKDLEERVSKENIKKWGLEDFHKLDDEDNPVLIFYTVSL